MPNKENEVKNETNTCWVYRVVLDWADLASHRISLADAYIGNSFFGIPLTKLGNGPTTVFELYEEKEGSNIYSKDNLPLNPKDYSYRDQIDTELTYEGGTGGWYNALKTTCWILDMEWLLKFYEELNWMNSDYFDEWVGDKIIEYLFEKDNYRERDYEIFLKGKGVI